MPISDKVQAAKDFWRLNRYSLKPYLIRDGKKHPFAIICPGGAYRMVCSFVEGRPLAKALNERGYSAFVVYYRTKKKARYPHPQEDLERAVREVFANADEWNLQRDGWSLWGSSAGGHLAASFCVENRDAPRPAALILSYPVVTMGEHTHIGTRNNLLGEAPNTLLADQLSVEKHITKDFPPTYLWNGASDDLVDPVNSRMLERALEATGVPHCAEIFEDVGHGVGLATGTKAEPWFSHAVSFWKAQTTTG